MKTEILSIIGRYIILLISLISCSPKDKFDWNANFSAPHNYPSGAPFVEYFYQGKSIAGASSGTGVGQGWGMTDGGYTGGEYYKPVPDSVAVRWVCSVDNYLYKGGTKLPREKMLGLFREGFTDAYGKHSDYGLIIAGMAPGGNVTIWLRGGNELEEITRFRVKEQLEDEYLDKNYREKPVEYWNDYLTHWKIHGVSYEVWEKGEKEYDYDISFSSEIKEIEPNVFTFFAKDGSWVQLDHYQGFYSDPTLPPLYSIELQNWGDFTYRKNNNLIKKMKLPIQIDFSFKYNDHLYISKVILPQDFEKTFLKANSNRIIIGIEKNINKGYIWLSGKLGMQKIMTFRATKVQDGNKNIYSLPKGFNFPKWQGRVKYPNPNFEYWQEH